MSWGGKEAVEVCKGRMGDVLGEVWGRKGVKVVGGR